VIGFKWHRASAVFWKDFLDLRKNRGLLASMAVLPMMLVVIPVGVVASYLRDPKDPALRGMAIFYDPLFPSAGNPAVFLVEKTLTDWFGLFLMMPIFIPILISSQSIAGEKEKRTLEPLLASPVTPLELLVGKSLASLVPSMALTWAAFALFSIAVNEVACPAMPCPVLPNGMWLFGVGVVAPMFALFGNGVAVVISARVSDSRTAQQLAGLFVLPIIGLVGAQIAGVLRAGSAYYALQGAVMLLLNAALVPLCLRLFDRDRMIGRWG